MNNEINIVLLEDDADMRSLLDRRLGAAGMNVVAFADAQSFGEALPGLSFHVLLLDINLPDESGFVVAARLRARSRVGIIMLTGRTQREDRLLGLSMGVDHYLEKPVDMSELESVIRNLARRLDEREIASNTEPRANDPQQPWTLDATAWQLRAPAGQAVDLSSAEYQLLMPLLETPGRAESRDVLNTRLGKPRIGPDNRSLDVLVSRVRRKIEQATGEAFPLRAARGAGYVFVGNARIAGAVGS